MVYDNCNINIFIVNNEVKVSRGDRVAKFTGSLPVVAICNGTVPSMNLTAPCSCIERHHNSGSLLKKLELCWGRRHLDNQSKHSRAFHCFLPRSGTSQHGSKKELLTAAKHDFRL